MFGLPPGDYVVSATLDEDRALFRRRSDDDEAATTGYAPTYFPGTTNAADAQRVTVGLGQEVSGIGFPEGRQPAEGIGGGGSDRDAPPTARYCSGQVFEERHYVGMIGKSRIAGDIEKCLLAFIHRHTYYDIGVEHRNPLVLSHPA